MLYISIVVFSYRIAKSYELNKSSGLEDYKKALDMIRKCREVNPNVSDINDYYITLVNDINKFETDERKVFKSFFRVS